MQGKRVFVSGGAGVIGLEIVPLLLQRGAVVFVGDLKARPASFPAQVWYRQGDLNTLTQDELGAFEPEVFIHLAATFERSVETYGFWEENFWHNVRLSNHLMTIAKDLPSLRRVVFASSYLIYDPVQYQFDTAQESPSSLKETDAIWPRNLVGMAKLAHEIELRFLDGFRDKSFTTICARIYRGYGRNSRDVISRWVQALLAKHSITVYRPEGIFDYIYAPDSAEGLVRLASSGTVTGVINLGTGKARRVQDVVDVLKSYFPEMSVDYEKSAIPFEASQADMAMYQTAIGWTPEYTLEQAIPEIIDFERSRLLTEKVSRQFGHILITSASRKVPLLRAVQDAAQKLHPDIKVICGDANDDALTRYVANEFWKMPRISDSEFDRLLAGLKERDVRVVIPTRDGELEFWARWKSRLFQAGIHLVVSSVESTQLCLDKLAFSRFGELHDFCFIPSSLTPKELGDGPYVVKERYGAGSRNIGLALDLDSALAHAATLVEPIYQPFVVGKEISIDAWLNKSHQVKGMILRSRDRVVDGESMVTTTFQNAKIESQMVRILEALKLQGPVVIQALVDSQGSIHVIECNARFGGASTVSIAAGLELIYWSLLEANDIDVIDYPFARATGEVRQVRVPCDIRIYDTNF